MTEQTRRGDEGPLPNQAANKEPAEGSRETVDDVRDSVKHGRESHIVNPEAEQRERREEKRRGANDPALPTGDASLRTEI